MRYRQFAIFSLLLIPNIVFATSLEVNINGVSGHLAKRIKNDLSLEKSIYEDKLSEDRIKNLYQIANEEIEETLQANGYYNSQIKTNLSKQAKTNEPEYWIANFTIVLGTPTTIANIEISILGPGKSDEKLQKTLVTPKLRVGQVLVHENYEDTKEELLANLTAEGYLQAKFTRSVIEVDRKSNTANIKFAIATGNQYTFGKITFIDKVYNYDFLIKFAPFKPGDPYELQKLIDFQNNFDSVDLFSKVRFDTLNDLEDPNNTVVPIQVRLTERPKNRYIGSIGYDTDIGAKASLGWLHRRRSTDGHTIYTNLSVSQRLSIVKANYVIPGSRPATDKYVLGILGQIETFEELYSRKAEISASKIFRRGKLETTYGVWYFTETFRIAHALPTLNKIYLLPTAKWRWLDTHNRANYEFGTRVDFKIRAGARFLFSDNSAAQFELNAKKIFPINDSARFLMRTSLGAVASKEFSILPPSLRFFTGGDDTVRGFAYNSLGPLAVPSDPDSVTGGRYLLIISGEFEHKIYDKISGVIFLDSGNAALSTKIPLAFGAGFGVRYRTPIGNLRLDLAKPLNTVVNKHWRVHVNFGVDL